MIPVSVKNGNAAGVYLGISGTPSAAIFQGSQFRPLNIFTMSVWNFLDAAGSISMAATS